MLSRTIISSLVCLWLSQHAYAATGSIMFNGTVGATCALNITSPTGVLVPSGTLQSLSSRLSGGAAGVVTVTTTGGVTLSLEPTPSAVTVPAGDTTSTVWTPSYSVTGAQTIANTTTATPLTAAGTNVVNVDLTGTKTGSNTFVSGAYSATVTVKCE